MKTRLALALIGILVMATLLNAATSQPAQTAATAGNGFAIDLYAQLQQQAGNLCISPYSISSALDMTSAGAVGETSTQMLSTLHWTDGADKLPTAAAALAAAIRDSGNNADSQLQIANALFGQNGYPYRPDFLNLLSNQYAAALQTVDFAGHPQQAAKQINQWAAQQTHDRIKQALDPSLIKPITRLVLVNAIYFKAQWMAKFNKFATADEPFFVDGKDSSNVPLMRQTRSFNYFGDDSLQLVEMQYRGGYSMVVVLPRAHDGLPALEKSLKADSLQEWLKQMQPQLLQLYFPRFQSEGNFALKDPLVKLGMTDAFNPAKADFSGIASVEKLNIDQVIHRTFIKVEEDGTEAAAVTAVTAVAASAMMRNPPQPVVLRADHPFLYFLRQQSTGTILFMGRVNDPR